MSEGLAGFEFDKPRDECGVFGVYAPDQDVAGITYVGLLELQHRGQDSAGIVIADKQGDLYGQIGLGLVDSVFTDGAQSIRGSAPEAAIGIGHVRYGTVEPSFPIDAIQPLRGVNHKFALSHNGHIANIESLAETYGIDITQTASDSDCVTKIIDKLLDELCLDDALDRLLPQLEGAYCLVITNGEKLIAVRDPVGYRPLSLGVRLDDDGYVVASEDPALKTAGATFLRDIEPGEILTIDQNGLSSRMIEKVAPKKICLFEYAYTARPDSMIEGKNVYQTRENLGRVLAREAPVIADIVIGVPDSGMAAAAGYAKELGIPFEYGGISKNPYTGRTFMLPEQLSREEAVKLKHRPNSAIIEGKRLVVVDDSVVRGTTMKANAQNLREAGAREIHLRIPTPAYLWPCFYGMDTGNPKDLLAFKFKGDVKDMAEYLGVDSLSFISEHGAEQAVGLTVGRLCLACANGDYSTEVPLDIPQYKQLLQVIA